MDSRAQEDFPSGVSCSGPETGKSAVPWYVENLHWTDTTAWWEHPATAYAAGLADGARLERERQDAEAAAGSVALSRAAVRAVEVVEARRAAA